MIKKLMKISFSVLIALALIVFSYVKYNNMNINDIGLKVLALVKNIKGNSVDLYKIEMANSPTINHNDWTNLLQKHVSASGKVNYKGFIQDVTLFQNYLDDLSQHPPGNNWTENEQLAYWINAYNAFTVKLIMDNYPLKSIKNISDGLPMVSSPWDIKFFKIGNIDFDLNTIEHEILRKKYNEPRIHFAINCASFSCPKLKNEAFTAEQLERQLETLSNDFLNNTDKNIINEDETKLSKIFDWFQSDFSKQGTLSEFIKKYNPNMNEQNKVEFLVYDWTLNE